MKKSKLIEALRTCDAAELAKFRQFVISPYFQTRDELVRLVDFLSVFHPGYGDPELTKQRVFQAVFPGEAYADKDMRYLMSDLYKALEQFWVLEKQRENTRERDLVLLDCLSERQLEKGYRQVARRLERELGGHSTPDHRYFQDQGKWFEVRERHFQRSRRRVYDDSIQRAAESLDRYYYLQRLRFTCAMLNRQVIFQEAYELDIAGSWIQHLRERRFFDEPIIELYFTIFEALLDENRESYFKDWKEKLGQLSPAIPGSDLKDIYLFAINYCARKIRQGRRKYAPEALQLYRTGIEMGILIENGRLSPWAFTNVVKLALSLQRYQWIEAFIPQYAPLLPEDFRENALYYNLAELYYHTRRFEKAQDQLNRVAFSDLNYSLGARVLLAKIYYETDEIEPLLSLLAAFIIFLKRNKQLSGTLKETYLNFCQLLYQLIRQNPRRLARLGEEIRTTSPLTDRDWLRQVYEQQTSKNT